MTDLRSQSKFLSYILRHHPEEIGVTIDRNGWVSISELVEQCRKHEKAIDLNTIEKIMAKGDKQRFVLSNDRKYIRAGYGHSIDVDLELKDKKPPKLLYHGTAQQFVSAILEEGIKAKGRSLVHLSSTVGDARTVGQRHGRPLILKVYALSMNNDGLALYQSESESSVWLTSFVPPEFIELQN